MSAPLGRSKVRNAGLCLAFLLVAVLGLPGCATPSQAVSGGLSVVTTGTDIGQQAPDFTLTDLEGNQVRLSDLRGKVVFINFWASWCPPCRAEMPDIETVHQKHKDEGVVVLGVDIQEPEEVVRRFVEEGGYSWTFLLDTTGVVTATYKVSAIPTSFFINRDGMIMSKGVGAMRRPAMEARLAEAMK